MTEARYLRQNDVITGRYVIQSRLGRGGMSNVYRAIDTLAMPPVLVAVKQFRLDGLPSEMEEDDDQTRFRESRSVPALTREKASEQFKFEAGLLHSLRHPNLPRVTNYMEEGNERYLVMDLIVGEDLERKLAANDYRPLPVRQVLVWIRQIINALIYCHSKGITHRDIKPSNIIVTDAGKVYVVDFGIAQLSGGTHPGIRARSRGYSSPEQERGEEVDRRTDIYSLGATLYVLMTGMEPENATNRVQGATLVPPSQVNRAISHQLESIILKAMALDPGNRYRRMEEFRDDLIRLQLWRPLLAALVAATLVGLAALIAAGFGNTKAGLLQGTAATQSASSATGLPISTPTFHPVVPAVATGTPTGFGEPILTTTSFDTVAVTSTSTAQETRAPLTPVISPTSTVSISPTPTATPTATPIYPAVVLREPPDNHRQEGDSITFEWDEIIQPTDQSRHVVFLNYYKPSGTLIPWKCYPTQKGMCILRLKDSPGFGEYDWTVFIVSPAPAIVSRSGVKRKFIWCPDSSPCAAPVVVPK